MKRFFVFFSAFFLVLSAVRSQSIVAAPDNPMYTHEGFAIISPVAGTWANKQPLVLEVPESFEVFYSFSGSHPMESGFAYDGPVMLEAEGEVTLRIALVFPHGDALVYTISYSVMPPQDGEDSLLDINLSQPLVGYSVGQKIRVPAGFSYKLGSSQTFLQGGQLLSLAGGTFPKRFLPCHVTDGVYSWRFVISPSGIAVQEGSLPMEGEGGRSGDAASSVTGSVPPVTLPPTDALEVEYYSASGSRGGAREEPVLQTPAQERSRLPFQITDWGTLTFTQDSLIYLLDDGYWQEATGSVVLDRSVGHTIYWQSIEYEKGNPVNSFYLPPKPRVPLRFEGRDAVTISLGQDFTIVPVDSAQGPLPSLCIDAFYGEVLDATFPIDVYYKDLYQGRVDVAVAIDKCPPSAPVIKSSSSLFYNRDEVTVSLDQQEGAEIFYSLEMLATEEAGFKDMELNLPVGTSPLSESLFLPYEGAPLRLQSHLDHAHLFLVRAFSQDQWGNRSPVVSYHTIVDPVNYYVSAVTAGGPDSDGSLARPFSSIEQVLHKTVGMDFVRIHLFGMIPVEEVVSISSNCEIIGSGAASGLVISPGSGLAVEDSQVIIKDCMVELQSFGKDSEVELGAKPALSVSKGSLSLLGCEVLGDYASSGTLISGVDATISLRNSDVTLRTGGYGALVSGIRSQVSVTEGRFTVVAPTAVVFSLSAGNFSLSGSRCKVFGNLVRVAELAGVVFSLVNNEFHGVFKGKSIAAPQLVPVWMDTRCKRVESKGNVVFGFPGS